MYLSIVGEGDSTALQGNKALTEFKMLIMLKGIIRLFVLITGGNDPLEKEQEQYMDDMLEHYDNL